MIAFLHPWAFALILPAAALWWWAGRGRLGWWRAALLAGLVAAAAGPVLTRGSGGSDVVLVLDRSSSMGDARAAAGEQIRLAAAQRGRRDRLAVVAAGAGVQIGQGPEPIAVPRASDLDPGEDGSDLAAGLDAALSLVPPGRSARVLLVSDGDATGLPPAAAAARLAAAGVPVDVLPVDRPPLPDAAVLDVELPGALRLGESFVGAVRLLGEARERRTWRILRDGAVIAAGEADLRPGDPVQIAFADRPPRVGVAAYQVELDAAGDREPRNNRARAVLRVAGAERVLVMAEGGNVAAALAAAGLAVERRPPGRLGLGDLLACDAVVLDDIPADAIGTAGRQALAEWVERLGGGLVMLGGRRSAGAGGWHRSQVERVLPVTFELRDELRKTSVALALALDRSGSMSAPDGGGRQKIDLANDGVCAAIAQLTARDQVAVYAVDMAVHTIIAPTVVADPAALAAKARGIESMGGGIALDPTLDACAAWLASTTAGVRHAIIFADAADSRQDVGDAVAVAARMRAAGITVSVIGMGAAKDVDADILTALAQAGGGRLAFADDPGEIPRLFAQETMLVSRSSWLDQPAALRPQPALAAVLGPAAIPAGAWPIAPGCNQAWPRPRAQVLAMAESDPAVPAVAAWRCGSGRSAWVGLDCDDAAGTALRAWSGYAPLLAGLARWCAGAGDRLPGQLTARRQGQRVAVRLELDPAERARWGAAAPRLAIAGIGEAGADAALEPADDGVWTGQFALVGDAVAVPAATIAGTALVGPALCLPYSPEAEPRIGQPPGHAALAAVAAVGGGRVRSDLAGLFANPPSPGGQRDLTWPLALIILVAALAELAWRRLGLELPAWRGRAPPVGPSAPGRPAPAPASATPPAVAHAPPRPPDPAGSPPAAPPAGGMEDALERLRRRRR